MHIITKHLELFWEKENALDASLILVFAIIVIREGIGCLLFSLI